MPKVTFVLTGDKSLNRKLARLAGKDAKKVVRKAIRPALKPVQQQARNNAKAFKQTGRLGKSIKIRAIKRSRARIGARVTTGDSTGDFTGNAYYGAFIEYGWKAGPRGSSNRTVVPGKHYMRRAVQAKRQEALRIYREGIRKNIIELAKKK